MRFLLLLIAPTYSFGWILDKIHEHCGTDHVDSLHAAIDQARMHRLHHSADRRMQKLACDQLCDGCIEIDTVFHYMVFDFEGTQVLPHPSATMRRYDEGDASLRVQDFTSPTAFRQILRDQIDVTNTALAGSPFRLRFVEDAVTTTDNNGYMRFPKDNEQEMSETLGSGDLSILDVYLSYTIIRESEQDDPPLRVGSTFLPSQQLLRKSDGMFLRYDTLTGGGLSGFDLGVTLTHELG